MWPTCRTFMFEGCVDSLLDTGAPVVGLRKYEITRMVRAVQQSSNRSCRLYLPSSSVLVAIKALVVNIEIRYHSGTYLHVDMTVNVH